jgi:hypothetical protein
MKKLFIALMLTVNLMAEDAPAPKISDSDKIELLQKAVAALNARIASLVKEQEMLRFSNEIGGASCAFLTAQIDYQKSYSEKSKACGDGMKLNEKMECVK